MTTRLNYGQMHGSVRRQIRAAVEEVAEHKQAVRSHSAALRKRLHESLTSPGMLLFAGGTGFAIGELSAQPGPAQDAEHPQKSSRRPMTRRVETALRFAFKVFTLAHAATATMGGPREIPGGGS